MISQEELILKWGKENGFPDEMLQGLSKKTKELMHTCKLKIQPYWDQRRWERGCFYSGGYRR